MAVVEGDSTLEQAENVLMNAVGMGSPQDQIVAGLILAGFIILTSSIGLVGTLLLTPLAFLLVVLGVLRLWGRFEDAWPLS